MHRPQGPVLEDDKMSSDSRAQNSDPTMTSSPPPDGGYGWVCCGCSFMINMHTFGINSSYGVFLAYYLANSTFSGASSLDYALIGSLSLSCAFVVSPIATVSPRLLGTTWTMLIGVLLQSASFIAASFATRTWQLFLSQGVCFGVGMGFLYVASVGIPSQWFTSRRSLAYGIAASGSGVGGLVYSLAVGAMLRSVGLAWTFRILGIIIFVVNSICALLMRDRNKAVGRSPLLFDMQLFRRPEYLLLNGFGWFSMLGYVVLIFSLANYANAIGLTGAQASIVSAMLNLGQALGRPPVGYFSDTVGRINMAMLMTFLAGLFSFAIWIPAQSYGVLIFFALIVGLVAGTFWATIAPLAAEVAGVAYVPSALNLEWLVIVLPCTFSEPIALEIAKGTGSYLGTELFVGFMYLAAASCLLLLRGWKIGEQAALAHHESSKTSSKSDDLRFSTTSLSAVDDDLASDDARAAGRRTLMTEFWKPRRV